MRTWVDRYPERLAFEIAGLERLGVAVDDAQLCDARRLVGRGHVVTDGHGEVDVTIVYPDSFPHLRPEVMAPGLHLGRHQNPYEGNLCLLDRSTREWEVDDTGAWLLAERLPLLLDLLARGGQALREGEAPQGEPWSTYLRYEPGTAVFLSTDALAIAAEHTSGQIELSFSQAGASSVRLRALLRRVSAPGPRGELVLAQAEEGLRSTFSGQAIQGRWVRLSEPPAGSAAEDLLQAAVAVDPRLAQPRWRNTQEGAIDVVGCLISEEVAHDREDQGWVFLVRIRRATGPRTREQALYLTRGERAGADDLAARIPVLRPLREKTVLLLGVGGLGAAIAQELARCGIGGITIIDGETLEAGNTVRWPIGFTAVGWPKAAALTGWIQGEHPHTTVAHMPSRVGLAPAAAELEISRDQSEIDVLDDLIEQADLVVDATAELGVQHLIAELAGQVPQLYVWATEGAAGGVVARVCPGTGCWMCLQLHIRDGTVPEPPRLEQGTVQPRGCASPTFTGASYDLAVVSNQAVRVAVAQLLGSCTSEQDLSVCSMHDGERWLPAPIWQGVQLERHAECGRCQDELAA